MVQLLSFDIGIKNMAYCFVKVCDNGNENGNGKKEIVFKNLNKTDLNLSKKANIQNIIENTIEFLDNLINHELSIDIDDKLIVLIECQMTSVMRTIQTTINTYFKMLNRYESYQIETNYVSPKHKLNIINKYQDKVASNSYKQNKIDAIYFCQYLLENTYKDIDINSHANNEKKFIDIYNGLKKKDDISDAFLMVIYYYEMIILS